MWYPSVLRPDRPFHPWDSYDCGPLVHSVQSKSLRGGSDGTLGLALVRDDIGLSSYGTRRPPYPRRTSAIGLGVEGQQGSDSELLFDSRPSDPMVAGNCGPFRLHEVSNYLDLGCAVIFSLLLRATWTDRGSLLGVSSCARASLLGEHGPRGPRAFQRLRGSMSRGATPLYLRHVHSRSVDSGGALSYEPGGCSRLVSGTRMMNSVRHAGDVWGPAISTLGAL